MSSFSLLQLNNNKIKTLLRIIPLGDAGHPIHSPVSRSASYRLALCTHLLNKCSNAFSSVFTEYLHPWLYVTHLLLAKLLQSCQTLCNPTDGSPKAPPSPEFSRQEHWSGLPFPSPWLTWGVHKILMRGLPDQIISITEGWGQRYAGRRFNNLLSRKIKVLPLVYINFHGVTTPTKMDFKSPTWHH